MTTTKGKKTSAGNGNASGVSLNAQIIQCVRDELLARKVKAGKTYTGKSNIWLDKAIREADHKGKIAPVAGDFEQYDKVLSSTSRLTQAIQLVRANGSGFVHVEREGAVLFHQEFDAEPAPAEEPETKKTADKAPAGLDVKKLASDLADLGFSPAEIKNAIKQKLGV